VPNSLGPILLTENDSTQALVADANKWRGNLPSDKLQAFKRDDQVVLFVKNITSMKPKEDENAFFVYAKVNGKAYRLTPISFAQAPNSPGTYALGVKLHDERGFNGQLPAEGCASLQIAWRGNISNTVRLALGKADGCKNERTVSTDASLDRKRVTGEERLAENLLIAGVGDRIRLMEQATFGSNPATDKLVREIGIVAWLKEQFNQPYPLFEYPNLPLKSGDSAIGCPVEDPNRTACLRDYYSRYLQQNHFFQEALYGEAQLRHRTIWALSQLWVTSGNTNTQGRWMEEYIKVLDRHAFGNYRDLMYEMTLNPAMGNYLDMIRSTRTNPNENYPREVLQLFTVGVYELNQDGTLVRDAANNPIPTYDQARIDNFTRIYTGWTFCNVVSTACPNHQSGIPNYIDPMRLVPGNHNTANSKALFNYPGAPYATIPACTDCTNDANRTIYAYNSLNRALDNIFYHPNVGPFVGKFLIQHLVTSDPSPAYVGRAAAAFNDNGAGVRGDMKAVIRAILLDPEARGDIKTDPNYGKLREPVQFVTNILRRFDPRSANRSQQSDGVINGVTSGMGQSVLNPPSVFNYYSPDYVVSVVPGTDVPGPEFGLLNTGTSFSRINFVNTIVFNQIAVNVGANIPLGTSIDLTGLQAIAQSDPTGEELIETLNEKMLHGVMSQGVKDAMRTAIQAVPASNPLLRARQALYVIAQSSQFQIQR
jgi:uncharacterized protein (DUF1800 family)